MDSQLPSSPLAGCLTFMFYPSIRTSVYVWDYINLVVPNVANGHNGYGYGTDHTYEVGLGYELRVSLRFGQSDAFSLSLLVMVQNCYNNI
ncbi:hypothetical protein CDAR_36891 [Caerostris darwini]|uniref:Uncharacterized protein n=1 Tax=Caerostris darwini TaxID=1538125 RepID=A0AAV4UV37_9ARAC|nr:hypothetical protein CDAR_36891 [Caerostris darwini]